MQAWCLRHSGAAFLSYAGNPFVGSRRTRFALRLARWVLPAPPRVSVVACSDHVARSLAAAPYYAHLPQRRFLNPVEAPEVRVHRARTLVPAEGVRLGMVARLDPIKDHALLLRAFAVLRRNWPKAELHLAGDGVLRSQLEELAQSLGIAAAVRFHGAVRDVPAFLDRLDLFCYFTTPQEGMGSAFAEALARGLPSLANDLPVLREVAGAGATCATRFVATDAAAASEAMDGLLRDRTERERLSALGWERVRETFSPRSIVRGYLAALELRP